MFGISSCLAITGLVVTLLSASCEVGVTATPVSLQVNAKGRYTPSDSQNAPCDMVVPQPDGNMLLYRDVDCDGVADYVLIGNRWIPVGPGGSHGPYRPGQLKPLPKELPYFDPGYHHRNALDFIRETGLDDLGAGDDERQMIWLHAMSTSGWTMDVTVPSTSRCVPPDFRQYGLDLEWHVVHSDKGDDFEAWRVSGDIDEVLRFLVDCGIRALAMETSLGQLDMSFDEETSTIDIVLDGSIEYSLLVE